LGKDQPGRRLCDVLLCQGGGKIQHLMHSFKYKGVQKIGNLLGNIAGEMLLKSSVFKTVDVIIPVPLHKTRLRKPGYNQTLCLAEGLSEKMGVPVDDNKLVRLRATETQTHRSRFSGFENMQEVFALTDPETLINKHILLVDDVVTTGSTLEACGAE
jgi:ComF family protein